MFQTQTETDAQAQNQPADGTALPDALPAGYKYEGAFDGELTFKEDTPEPKSESPLYYWRHPDEPDYLIGVYQSDEYASEGYPYVTAVWIDPVYDGVAPYWKHSQIAESWEAAVEGARRTADHRAFMRDSKPAETYPEWEARTGGTEYEAPTPPWEAEEAEAEEED